MNTTRRFFTRSAGVAMFTFALAFAGNVPAFAGENHDITRAALEPGKVRHIVVIDLENEDFSFSFGPNSPAKYLNNVLVKQGQLIENYYGTSHASMGNYVSQFSGQASTQAQNNDCINLGTLVPPFANIKGSFTEVTTATPTADDQVIGDGCVFPASVQTIANQLDDKYGHDSDYVYPWRVYAEDMGNDPARDYGTPDPMGGTSCAHPPIGGDDFSNSAVAGDSYATRHNPAMYFRSIIDDKALCNDRVVPLGTVVVGHDGAKDTFIGHLAQDLEHKETTPAFSFIVPDLCNDGHDAACKPAEVGGTATDIEGGNAGGLAAADIWLKHWIPLLMNSDAYRSGEMLIVVTFDEGGISPAGSAACCNQPSGPNQEGNPGYATLLKLFGFPAPTAPGQYPGGGKTGAVLLSKKFIQPGSVNTTGEYNHYSALRSYEDLLGLTTGGTDGYGHLGFAGREDLKPFGTDVFNRKK